MSSVAGVNCLHNHLFDAPLCEQQDLFRRIANVAFHVFTLGIPLAIYKIFHYSDPAPLPAQVLSALRASFPISPYPPEAQEAIQFARDLLKQREPFWLPGFVIDWQKRLKCQHQPVNKEIPRLMDLFYRVHEEFGHAARSYSLNSPEVIQATERVMKVSYAVSVLTLEDLEAFTSQFAPNERLHDYAFALRYQRSYQYRTFYYCTQVYHQVRGDRWEDRERFFTEGTIESSWRNLYNDYCKRTREYVSHERLEEADTRHANWTYQDLNRDDFRVIPDGLPT
jgi:hypothetical protein